ncbi:LysR family transcriptional regulator [Euryhalocaulis caribicus]|uniref:LysR family transcriptional regulator n=1 Tax=Euryhalocaulis caribicus TaxID=1161401 RepID=UPI00039D0920|nr:LysR family transcriptional regulator [Euryhalocaulis caribicus]
MDHIDWDKLKTFHAAAEAGSLTAAAEALHVSQSAVSRQIAALEDDLGVALFHRHARGLLMTEQGERLFEIAHDMAASAALAEAKVRDARDQPSGDLRVTTTIGLGAVWLSEQLPDFVASYPDVKLHLILDDRELDLTRFEADVALRPWEARQSDLIQRKLFQASQSLYASNDYIARNGPISSIDALDDHPLILYGADAVSPMKQADWAAYVGRLEGEKPRQASLTVDNLLGVVKATAAGAGIAGLPDYIARTDARLSRVLPEVSGPGFDVYFLYPEELKGSKRLIVFRDFILRAARRFGLR